MIFTEKWMDFISQFDADFSFEEIAKLYRGDELFQIMINSGDPDLMKWITESVMKNS